MSRRFSMKDKIEVEENNLLKIQTSNKIEFYKNMKTIVFEKQQKILRNFEISKKFDSFISAIIGFCYLSIGFFLLRAVNLFSFHPALCLVIGIRIYPI